MPRTTTGLKEKNSSLSKRAVNYLQPGSTCTVSYILIYIRKVTTFALSHVNNNNNNNKTLIPYFAVW